MNLRLRRPFRISRGTKTHQVTVIVRVSRDDLVGYGEASPNEYYGVDLDRMQQSLRRCADAIRDVHHRDADQILDLIRIACEGDTFSMAACDIAIHDLFAKADCEELSDWLQHDVSIVKCSSPPTSITFSLGSMDEVDEQIKEYGDWPILKVKLGGPCDLQVIERIRECSSATIRVDANAGWTPDQAIRMSHKLADLGVEFIEQPIAAGDWEGQSHLHKHSQLPLIADESCVRAADIPRCVGLFDGINIKLGKCGGIREACQMIREARSFDLQTMIGCMTESAIAMAAGRSLASRVDHVDLDGSTLLANDTTSGFSVSKGQISKPFGYGLCIETRWLDLPLLPSEN